MKLVDILAHHFKEWPCLGSRLCQGHKGHIYTTAGGGALALAVTELAEDWKIAEVGRDQWQAAVDALKGDECDHSEGNAEGCPECGLASDPAWPSGELPPVGTVCEHFGTADHTNWIEVQVIGHGHVRHQDVAFFEYMIGTNGYTVSYSTHTNFRQLRTPEQIAAEDRDKEIRRLIKQMPLEVITGHTAEIVAWMLDQGYRKQESGK